MPILTMSHLSIVKSNLLVQKQSDSAMLTINTLIALMPDNPTGYIEKGNLFRQINQADSANYYYMLGKSKQP